MRRPGEGRGLGRRRKHTLQHSASGMSWSKAGMQSENSVELLKQILAQCYKFVIFRKWHGLISFLETPRLSFLCIRLSNHGISRSIQQFGILLNGKHRSSGSERLAGEQNGTSFVVYSASVFK